MGGCTTQTTLIDVVHGDMCICALLTPLTFTQGWIHERCGRYRIQFRSNSVCRLSLRRAPAVDLSSLRPGQWGQHDNWVQLALQRPRCLLQYSQEMTKKRLHGTLFRRQPQTPLAGPAVQGLQLGLGPARGRLWGPCRRPARAQDSLPWSTRDGFT
jgi:hypothetical protein